MSESKAPSGELKSLTIGQFFDALQEQQREAARQAGELEQLKTILAVHGKNLDETLTAAKELFDLRTQMVTADYDRIMVQFREVSAVFQTAIAHLNDSIDERFLRFERKIDSLHQEDMTLKTARITRTQIIAVATIGFLGTVLTATITAAVTLAVRGGP